MSALHIVRLGGLVKQGRERNGLTQELLADRVDISKQWLSRIEVGDRLPSLALMMKLHGEIAQQRDADGDPNLSIWLLKWVEERALHDGELSDRAKSEIATMLATGVVNPNRNTRPDLELPISLENFPDAFYPLTVVCADRREPNPVTKGDIFAYSIAITDLMFLPQLGLDPSVRVRSDKLFTLMDDEYLKDHFGNTHLLIIGSPAVNLATRRMNSQALFRFDWDQDVKDFEQTLRGLTELNDRRTLEVFWEIVQQSDRGGVIESKGLEDDQIKALEQTVENLCGREGPKVWMNKFRKPGLVDLADGLVHAQSVRQDNDFGVISLARNPFSKSQEYVCILAAGVHGPGTAHAVRALAEDDFKDHPYGGVIEVQINQFQDWPTRFEKGHWRWQTGKYTNGDLLTILEDAVRYPERRRPAFSSLTEEEIEDCRNFVKSIIGDPEGNSNILTPSRPLNQASA